MIEAPNLGPKAARWLKYIYSVLFTTVKNPISWIAVEISHHNSFKRSKSRVSLFHEAIGKISLY